MTQLILNNHMSIMKGKQTETKQERYKEKVRKKDMGTISSNR